MQLIAQPREPAEAVQEIAGLTADMTQFATILRLSEDLAFWQGVSIMGAQNDWEFSKNSEGTEIWAWTYRLGNSLDKSLYDGNQASLAIARSRVLTTEEKTGRERLVCEA
ncbi:MAG: hypothetical protein KJO15_11855 [Alphaproteobacteria bacterium]|nr:hypothetical protein [Alphaproteobacteria bacterium]